MPANDALKLHTREALRVLLLPPHHATQSRDRLKRNRRSLSHLNATLLQRRHGDTRGDASRIEHFCPPRRVARILPISESRRRHCVRKPKRGRGTFPLKRFACEISGENPVPATLARAEE